MSTKIIVTCDSCGALRGEDAEDWNAVYGLRAVYGGNGQRDFCPRCFRSVAEALKCVAPVDSPPTAELDQALCDATVEVQRLKAETAECKSARERHAPEIVRLMGEALEALIERDIAVEDVWILLGLLGKKARKKHSTLIAEIELRHPDGSKGPALARIETTIDDSYTRWAAENTP